MKIGEAIFEAKKLLGRVFEDIPHSDGDKELLRVAFDALGFIRSSGQAHEFEDYRKTLWEDSPAPIVAAFTTYDEADAWIQSHPKPPHLGYVLAGDNYYIVFAFRPSSRRGIYPHPTLELYLERMMQEGLPEAVSKFKTHQEARDWFNGLSERPAQAVIDIGGEPYLAVHYRNIDHVALHAFSLVEKEKRRRGEVT